jgi:hypothetical protein
MGLSYTKGGWSSYTKGGWSATLDVRHYGPEDTEGTDVSPEQIRRLKDDLAELIDGLERVYLRLTLADLGERAL